MTVARYKTLRFVARHAFAFGFLTIVILVFGAASVRRVQQSPSSPAPMSTPSSSPTPATIQDPIQIEAIRSRAYSSSPITPVQTLPAGSGFTNQIVSYQSDGLKIYALLATPTGTAPAGGWPVIILDHGYSDPATYQTNGAFYQPFIAAFARAGYVVIKPDFRGHGQSQGQAEGGHFSPVYAYDNLNLIESLKNYSGVNPGRIGLFGHSMGGHVALRTIVATPDVKATVMLAGVVGSFEDILYSWPNSPMPNDQPTALVTGKRQALLEKFGDPHANPTFWGSASAINYVANVKGSVYIAHDAADSTVPKVFADHLNAALTTARKDVTYKLYPGDDHLFVANRSAMLADVIAYYKARL